MTKERPKWVGDAEAHQCNLCSCAFTFLNRRVCHLVPFYSRTWMTHFLPSTTVERAGNFVVGHAPANVLTSATSDILENSASVKNVTGHSNEHPRARDQKPLHPRVWFSKNA